MEGDFRVGEWLVQPKVGTITKGDQDVSLEPKVMEVLVYLARHTDDVLPKERIIHAVWGDTFVTDEVLTNAISELRRAFGDDAKDPHTIQTLPRRGYRLIATVTPCGANGSEVETSASRQLWKQSVLVVLATVSLLAFVLTLWWNWPASPDKSLAVLPFENLSGDPENEYFSDGLTDEIIAQFSRNPNLKVISRTSSMQYKDAQKSLPTIGAELGVTALLEGTVRKQGNRVRITAQLINAKEEGHLWSQTFDRDLTDIFDIQTEVSQEIAKALNVKLGGAAAPVPKIPTAKPKAYDLYLKGKFYFNQGMESSIGEAIELFEQAIGVDPEYAQAYASLAGCKLLLAKMAVGPSKDYMQQAESLVTRALQLDGQLPEGHLARAQVLAFYRWNWDAAEEAYRRVLELNPTSAAGLDEFSRFLILIGKYDDSLNYARMAKELDPLGVSTNETLSYALGATVRYSDAEMLLLDFLRFHPNEANIYWPLGLLYTRMQQYEKAITAFQRQISLMAGENISDEIAKIAIAYALWGRQEEAERNLEQLAEYAKRYYVSSVIFAEVYAAMGDAETTFRHLEEALQQNDCRLAFICRPDFFPKGILVYDALRDDPRSEQLLRKLNLPEDAIQRHVATAEGTP